MTFETALRSRLKTALPGVTVVWDARPQASDYPALVLEMAAGARARHYGGTMTTQGDRVQASVFAMTQKEAKTLRDTAMTVLEGAGTEGGITFQGGFVNFYASRSTDTNTATIYSEIIDATIWHS